MSKPILAKPNSLSFEKRYIDPLIWWMQSMTWSDASDDRPQDAKPSSHQCSFHELAINFEHTTGVDLPGETWDETAKQIHIMMRTVAKVFGIHANNIPTTFKELFMPASQVNVFLHFGAYQTPGLRRRPHFLQHRRTMDVIAVNVWKAIANHRQHKMNDSSHSSKAFTKRWNICRLHMPSRIEWDFTPILLGETLSAVIKGIKERVRPQGGPSPDRPPSGHDAPHDAPISAPRLR